MNATFKSTPLDCARLTPQLVQDVLEGSVQSALAAGLEDRLSQLFLEGLRQACGAAAIRVWELWKTNLRLVGLVGAEVSRGVTERVLCQRHLESTTGLLEHTDDEIQSPSPPGSHPSESWRLFTTVTELAPGAQLILEFCFSGPAGLSECSDSAGEVYADLRRRELVLQQRRFLERFGTTELLIQRLHESPEKMDVLRILATEGAAVLGCYRVSVCERAAGRWRIVAATGGTEVNERADEVRRICGEVQRAEEAGAAEGSTVRNAAAAAVTIPLSLGGKWSFASYALHLEYRGTGGADLQTEERVVRHAVTALRRHGRGLAGDLPVTKKPAVRLWLSLGLVIVGVLAAVPHELSISASGELQPAQRKSVYVSESGVVEELLAEDGGEIRSGQLLLRLRNDELLLERETLLGELLSVQARQAAVDAIRSGRSEGQQVGLQAGEPAELAARDESLRRQLSIIEHRLSSLEVRAPQSGRVISEELRERFFGRPVQRGQHVCDVADLQGSWELRLEVSEMDVRHVLESAGDKSQEDVGRPYVRFFLETSPDVSHSVPLGAVSGVTELDKRGNSVVSVTAQVPAGKFEGLRPGSGVRAVICCGRAPAGYVYLRRLIDVVLRQVLL